MLEEVQKLTGAGNQVLFSVPNTGEVERLADIFTEYNVSFDWAAAPAAAKATPTRPATSPERSTPPRWRKPTCPMASFSRMRISRSSGRAICSTNRKRSPSRPQRQKSKVSAFLSDFRDLQVGDYVVHVEHGIGQYQGLKEINQGDGNAEFMLLEYAEGARLYVPLTRLDLIQKYRSPKAPSRR